LISMENVRQYLGMKYNLIGVKILTGEIPQDELDELRPDTPKQYCQFVEEAALGKSHILTEDDFSCPSPIVTLGFQEPVYVDIQPRISPADTRAVKIGPLDAVKDPDVVLALLNPKQIMEVTILLDGIEAKFGGNMAVCGEGTARPYMEGKPNVTFLCQGARIYGGYKDNELILGSPLETFKKLSAKVEELSKTCGALCGCLTSDISPTIIKGLASQGFEKGTDYFFGKVDGKNVRIYLNKDLSGRIDFITIHLPIKGEVKVNDTSLMVATRGKWTDVSSTHPLDGSIELETGKGLIEAIKHVISKVST
jgi:uncharacterized protein (DUF169 family)